MGSATSSLINWSAVRTSRYVRGVAALAALTFFAQAVPASAQQLAMVMPQVNVTVAGGSDRSSDSRGTAFLVGRDTWVTAAHVVNGCAAVYVRAGGEWRVASNLKVHGSADVAVFSARQDERTKPLALSTRAPGMGDTAIHIGFARGEFTAVETRASAAANVRLASTGGTSSGYLFQSTDGNSGDRRMNGVSGGPQLDARGAVQGVTISYGGQAGQPLRLTTVPVSELQGFLPANVQLASGFEGFVPNQANQMRTSGSVTSVYCATTTSTRNLPRT
jgi:hypothetical protein